MRFPDEYFYNEVREGFFVPSMIKRAWAAQLDVLEQIDRICKKYNLQYFAEWGTLLGAVRHNGFIPWDDDMDIGMKRADYERFLEVAPRELPESYKINNCRNRTDFWLFLANVINIEHISFEEEHLRKYHEFPYVAGVDIFLIDYVARDEKKEKKRDTIADFIITLADHILEKKISGDDAIDGFRKINKISRDGIVYDEPLVRRWLVSTDNTDDEQLIAKLCQSMYIKAEKMFGMFTADESDELTQLFPFGMRRKEYRYPKEYYEDSIRLPFENTTIPVPIGYDAMLKRRYGAYMTVHKNISAHQYPVFESQQERLDNIANVRLPSYKFDAGELEYANGRHSGENRQNSFRQLAKEVQKELANYNDAQKAQALAIDFGTMIEKLYGTDHPMIAVLEDYCERLYQYSQGIIDDTEIMDTVAELNYSIQNDIIDVMEVAFIVSRVSQWRAIKHEFCNIRDTDAQIYIVVVPYYSKRFDGTLYSPNNDYEQFCVKDEFNMENVHVVKYDEYDIALHHPYCVYIQNPYDGWDKGISIHPSYYTDKLVGNCDKLIYVPPFALDEFTKENYCEYHNMSSYVTVPGVVRADEVLVQSDAMREMYIMKLTEWAGGTTRGIWDKKIIASGTQLSDCENAEDRRKTAMDYIPESWKKLMLRSDGSVKKIVLYHNETSIFMENGDKAFDKIRMALEIFSDNKENVFLIWNIQEDIAELIKAKFPQCVDKLKQLENYADSVGICDISDGRFAQAVSDAFYGEACYLSRLCQIDGKPVMIEDVNIL